MKLIMIVAAVVGLCGLTPMTRAQEASSDQERIAQLEKDLKAAIARIEALEEQIAKLTKPTPGRAARPVSPKPAAPEPVASESRWQGMVTWAGTNEQTRISATVTAREPGRFKMRTDTENGAIWEWECSINESAFQVVNMNRIRAARGNAAPPGTAGLTGGGTVIDGVMTLKFDWPKGTTIDHGTIVMRKQ